MADIAAISVISSAVVGVVGGLGGPALTAWRTDRREERAAKNTRFDELRVVLDDASIALQGVVEAFSSPAADFGSADYLGGLQRALHGIWRQQARIAARVGTANQLYLTYGAATDRAGELMAYFDSLRDAGIEAVNRDRIEQRYRPLLEDFARAQDAFFEETTARIGPVREGEKGLKQKRLTAGAE